MENEIVPASKGPASDGLVKQIQTAIESVDGTLTLSDALSQVQKQALSIEVASILEQMQLLRANILWMSAKLQEWENDEGGIAGLVDLHKQFIKTVDQLRKQVDLYHKLTNKKTLSVFQAKIWVDGIFAAVAEGCSDPQERQRILDRIRALTSLKRVDGVATTLKDSMKVFGAKAVDADVGHTGPVSAAKDELGHTRKKPRERGKAIVHPEDSG